MSNPISAAIEVLEDQLRQQLEDVAATKRLINQLLTRTGEPVRYQDVSVGTSGGMRADEYYGKTVTGAAQMYLERQHRALGAEEITKGLQDGGFDFKPLGWTEAARVRNIAISLAKNPKIFHKLPNGTWGLTEWYPGVAAAKAKSATAATEPSATETPAGAAEEVA